MQNAIDLPDLTRLDPDTRMRIDRTVLEIFSSREFHRIGLIEIARGANVSLQTIYKYYGSKEALLFSGLDFWLGQLTDELLPHLERSGDTRTRLRGLFDTALSFFERNPKVMQMIMSSMYLNTWRESKTYRNHEAFGPLIKLLSEGRAKGELRTDVSEIILLDYLQGIMFRLVQAYVADDQRESLTAQSNALFDMLWRAVEAPTSMKAAA
jgi:TetR/AcrR family transcriptional regulator, repressor of fatR-cypB operon